MKVIYKGDNDRQLVYYSFNKNSTVKELLNELEKDGERPRLLIFKSSELTDKSRTLGECGFSAEGANTVYKTRKETLG